MAGQPAPMDTDDIEQEKTRNVFGSLRRVSSAPLINIGSISDCTPVYESSKPPRPRTFSASFSQGCHSLFSTGVLIGDARNSNTTTPVGSPASRVLQIKKEESISDSTREVIRERDVTAAMQLSRSMDEISWMTDKAFNMTEMKRDHTEDFPSAFSSPVMPLSPSHMPENRFARTRSLTPSPGPVPLSPKVRNVTRFSQVVKKDEEEDDDEGEGGGGEEEEEDSVTSARSLSPSNLKPSAFTPKRKLDPEDTEQYCSPSKRLQLCHSSLSTSSASSSSSPDTGAESVHNSSGFEDEDSFMYSTSNSSLSNHNNLPLMCDTRHPPFTFVKPKHVAPPSPLAAGSNSASIQVDPRRSGLGGTSYTFTPVRD